MKLIFSYIVIIFLLSVSSCSNKVPIIRNFDNGIVAIPIEATNTSSIGFTRHYKLYPHTNPDLVISIFPVQNQKFIFSKEMPPGKYTFNRIKYILDSRRATSTKHMSVQAIKMGIEVEVLPGSVTMANQKFFIKQYKHYDKTKVHYVETDWRFHILSDSEMKEHIQNLKNIEGMDKLKIAN